MKVESEEEDESLEEPFMVWNSDGSNVDVPEFTEHVGPTRRLPRDATPLSSSCCCLQLITRYTNKNALDLILAHPQMNGAEEWTQTTAEEIMAFLGIVILMGVVKLPATHMYWSLDERLNQAGVVKIFPRDRFLILLKYFYCNDPSELPHKDDPEYKLYRVKPILEELSRNFLIMYDPHREQSIDEAMVKFKGRLKFLQVFERPVLFLVRTVS